MKKGVYRLCSVLLAVLMLFLAVAPVYATETDYVSKDTFWRWMAGSGGVVQKIIGYSLPHVCPASDDGYHHASSYTRVGEGDTFECNCIYCGDVFIATESDVKQSYDDYVQTLPAQGYTSSGELRFRLNVDRFSDNGSSCRVISSDCGPTFSCSFLAGSTTSSVQLYVSGYLSEFLAPVSGNYRLVSYLSSSSPSVRYKTSVNSTYKRAWLLGSQDRLRAYPKIRDKVV